MPPYRRRYRRRYPVRRRRKYRRRRLDNFDLARQAWKGVMQLKRMVNVEYKQHVVNSPTNAVSDTEATALDLAVIPIGDTQSTRDGTSIKPINLVMRMITTQHASATNTQVRVVIFRSKAENDNTPTTTSVFGTATFLVLPKVQDRRFNTKILYDRYISLSSAGKSNDIRTIILKLHGHINFDNEDTTGDDKEAGGLYMCLVSNEATNTPNVQYYSRLTFTDN